MTATIAIDDNVNGRPASLVDWALAPDWVSRAAAAHLCGVGLSAIEEIIDSGGVDTVEADGDILIDRRSLREYWELFWELGDYAPA